MENLPESALELAIGHMKAHGYRHGPCLSIVSNPTNSRIHQIELAYEGFDARSNTTDPPSILLQVDLATMTVQSAEM
jgi:hypothetical protein